MEVITPCKFKLKLFLLILLAPHFTQGARVSFQNCGGDLPVKLKDLTISPGQNANASFSTEEVIEEGAYFEVTVKLGFLKLLHKKFDVCEEASKLNSTQISCPISPGDYALTHSLPRDIPRAKYVVSVRIFDAANNELGCLDSHVDLKK